VVASRDRRFDLARTLPCHEAPVILVDNGSSDGTVAFVGATLPAVTVVSLPTNRGAPARNVGVRLADTPYVAFADDDSWWEAGSLARAVEVLDAHPRAALVAARVLVGADDVEDPICATMAAAPLGRATDLPGPSVLGFLACAVVVRRSAFLEVGGFDDVVFFGGEEERVALDLAAAGWGMSYVPELVVHHHPSPSRDPHSRTVQNQRNRLLLAVLRRPWGVVARRWRTSPARVRWDAPPSGPPSADRRRRSGPGGTCRRPWRPAAGRSTPPADGSLSRAFGAAVHPAVPRRAISRSAPRLHRIVVAGVLDLLDG
jgi:GT2 family glycosyltransferase